MREISKSPLLEALESLSLPAFTEKASTKRRRLCLLLPIHRVKGRKPVIASLTVNCRRFQYLTCLVIHCLTAFLAFHDFVHNFIISEYRCSEVFPPKSHLTSSPNPNSSYGLQLYSFNMVLQDAQAGPKWQTLSYWLEH